MPPEINFLEHLAERRATIETELAARLPASEQAHPSGVYEAMRYSVFAGGKRLRPMLSLAAAEAVSGSGAPASAMTAGLAVEILHTYSLIHDDLPCMDDDELRRGKPTCHIAFGEATAVLAGDALLTLAFEWLASTGEARLVTELAQAAGACGMIGGQELDMRMEKEEGGTLEDLQRMHHHKTGALISASLRMGGLCAGASKNQLEALTTYGRAIGLAFQIVDDILDTTASTEELGKPAGSDEARGKLTYTALLGPEASRERAEALVVEAKQAIQSLHGSWLSNLADYIVARSH